MSVGVTPCLSLAIARLTTGNENFAIWVTQSPLPGAYVHHDSIWSEILTGKWLAWQEMFAPQNQLHIPVAHESVPKPPFQLNLGNPEESYSGRLMQELGISLWQWLFDGATRQSLAQSRGIAIGKNQPLRLRLEIRDPNLIPLPWEIMQPDAGTQAISLNSQILFSRTTSDVDPLMPQPLRETLSILLVLGDDGNQAATQTNPLNTQSANRFSRNSSTLQLEKEALILAQAIEQSSRSPISTAFSPSVSTRVKTLVQPTPAELIEALDTGDYNLFFYAGHGKPAPDGGLLFLQPQTAMNGTELAQVLVRNRVTLAVFNACWGAQPQQQGQKVIERSSLAEVLIHHGVPAVLGMRDSIADREALTFIQVLTKSLTQRMSIDQAVRVARQQLLTLYKFNQPAWTLPILYMHPEFEGGLIKPLEEGITELPIITNFGQEVSPSAYLCSSTRRDQVWEIYGGLMRVGRHPDNDLVIQERWVSQRHAEIIYREATATPDRQCRYFLKDFSRFGTFVIDRNNEKQKIHHQEIPLESGIQLQFGSSEGQILEFIIQEKD